MKSFILRHLVVGRLGARALFSPAEHRWDTASPIQQHVAELIASVIKAEGGAGYCEGVAGETGVVTQRRCDCAGTRHPFTAGVGVALRPGLTDLRAQLLGVEIGAFLAREDQSFRSEERRVGKEGFSTCN